MPSTADTQFLVNEYEMTGKDFAEEDGWQYGRIHEKTASELRLECLDEISEMELGKDALEKLKILEMLEEIAQIYEKAAMPVPTWFRELKKIKFRQGELDSLSELISNFSEKYMNDEDETNLKLLTGEMRKLSTQFGWKLFPRKEEVQNNLAENRRAIKEHCKNEFRRVRKGKRYAVYHDKRTDKLIKEWDAHIEAVDAKQRKQKAQEKKQWKKMEQDWNKRVRTENMQPDNFSNDVWILDALEPKDAHPAKPTLKPKDALDTEFPRLPDESSDSETKKEPVPERTLTIPDGLESRALPELPEESAAGADSSAAAPGIRRRLAMETEEASLDCNSSEIVLVTAGIAFAYFIFRRFNKATLDL